MILYQLQDNLLYHPEDSYQSRYYVQIPPVVGLPYENIFTRSIDGTLIHMYFIPQTGEKSLTAPTLVFFHGNAGNMGHRYSLILINNLKMQNITLVYFLFWWNIP